MSELPLYKELKDLDVDISDYTPKKLADTIKSLPVCPENENENSIQEIIHLLILHHYLLYNNSTFSKSKGILPYQSKTYDKNKGILYQVENLPEEICLILYKLMKVCTN